MKKLALQIPLSHWYDLVGETDFEFALVDYLVENKAYRDRYIDMRKKHPERDCWLDNSFNEMVQADGNSLIGVSDNVERMVEGMKILNPTHLVTMEHHDPEVNFALVKESVERYRAEGFKGKIVGIWHGELYHYNILQEICSMVALPYDVPRERLYSSLPQNPTFPFFTPAQLPHYLGYRGMWELLKPGYGLDTDAPIVGAVMGVDFRLFEGRPMGMPKYNPDLKLSKGELSLAISNIRAMKRRMK